MSSGRSVIDSDFPRAVTLRLAGDLRYAAADGGPFLDPGHTVPKLVSLPRLLAAADRTAVIADD